MAAAAGGGVRQWRIIPRPLLETVLHNHALHHRVPQLLLFHGPRGVGKSSLLLHRLLPEWNKGPHIAAYVDFAAPATKPWAAISSGADLADLRRRLEQPLESLARRAVLLGAIGSRDIFAAISKWHGLRTALRRIIGPNRLTARDDSASVSALWTKAVLAMSGRANEVLGDADRKYSMEEAAYMKEAVVALGVAKEVIVMQQEWRREAVRELNRVGGFSRSLANSATDWPCLLIEILSQAAEVDFFQVWDTQKGI